MIYKGQANEYFQLENIENNNHFTPKALLESPLTFLWFEGDNNVVIIDGIEYRFSKNQVVSLTELHKVKVVGACTAKMIRFNKQFYCIIDHDSEVGCKGILFFGASQVPVFDIPQAHFEQFQNIWNTFEIEMQSKDDLQLEMLQSMLKRFIILGTRIFKTKENFAALGHSQVDIVREFNFLVEQHFRTKHTVSEYAQLLHKSPKTLSNLFSKIATKSPLQFIQERKLLEARRALRYTTRSIKEIAYEIGFEDPQAFSRFFKNYEGLSPTEFREKK